MDSAAVQMALSLSAVNKNFCWTNQALGENSYKQYFSQQTFRKNYFTWRVGLGKTAKKNLCLIVPEIEKQILFGVLLPRKFQELMSLLDCEK
jgi:hypothetical protein